MDCWVPIEVWKRILDYVGRVGLARVQLVSKGWNKMYWRHLTSIDCSHKRLDVSTTSALVRNVNVESILYLDLTSSELTTDDMKHFSMLHRLIKLKMANLDFSRIDFNTRSLDYVSRLTNLRSLEIPITSSMTLNASFLLALTKLVTLNLSGWKIDRDHLKLLGHLKTLRNLTLKRSTLEGGGFQSLQHLEYLDLSGLKMLHSKTTSNDLLTLSYLTSLYELYLRDSCVSLTYISPLTQLESLDFTTVTHDILRTITSQLTNLVSLSLYDCSSLHSIPTSPTTITLSDIWKNLTRLKCLTLRQAVLEEFFFPSPHQTTLTTEHHVSTAGGLPPPSAAYGGPPLCFLTLKGCTVSPGFLERLGEVSSGLVYVSLKECNLSNVHYEVVSNFRELRTLIVKDDYLLQSEVSLDPLSKLTGLCQLTMKNLHCNSLKFLEHLVQLKSFGLVHLHLSNGVTTEYLSKLTNLERLYITSFNTDRLALLHLTKLQSLTLAQSGILSNFISTIIQLPRLQWLDVSRMYLSESDKVVLARTIPFVGINWSKE